MNTFRENLTFTICIPTYYGGPALVEVVKSLRNSQKVKTGFRIIVSVDANPLQKSITKQLQNLKVEILENTVRGGQVTRIKQMVQMVKTDIAILTQDDVIFDSSALSEILKIFQNKSEITMTSARIEPFPSETFFEKVIQVGVFAAQWMGRHWRNGDNYLLSSGRCLAFRTDHLKKIEIPSDVINSDAYLYFINKQKRGQFLYASEAVVFNKVPQNFTEHLKQHRKFLISQAELNKYLEQDLRSEYSVPVKLQLQSLFLSMMKAPVMTVLYLLANIWTMFVGKDMFKNAVRFWDTDVSTKRVSIKK